MKKTSTIPYADCPYSSAKIMCAVVLEMNRQGNLTQDDVTYLLSRRATLDLKLGGVRCLKLSTGELNEHMDEECRIIFMRDRKLKFGGKEYLFCGRSSTISYTAAVKWIGKHGFTIQQAIKLCEQANMKPKLQKK